MISDESIQNLADQIVERFHPERIILFGSYAYGNPKHDSDVDMLVVMPFEGSSLKTAVELRNSVTHDFPIDFIVRTPVNLRWRIENEDFFLREITERGKGLYEADH